MNLSTIYIYINKKLNLYLYIYVYINITYKNPKDNIINNQNKMN